MYPMLGAGAGGLSFRIVVLATLLVKKLQTKKASHKKSKCHNLFHCIIFITFTSFAIRSFCWIFITTALSPACHRHFFDFLLKMNPALQNRDMYGAINDQNHFPTYPNKEQEPEPTYTIAKIIGIFFLVGSLAALAVTDNFVLKQSSSASLKKSKTSTTDDINWSIYKHTTSVTTGTYTAVNDFVATYITYVSDIVDLGCSDSMKVSLLFSPFEFIAS